MTFLNERKGENDHRNDFMINLKESYVAELEFELVTPGSAVRCATNCVMDRYGKGTVVQYYSPSNFFQKSIFCEEFARKR